MIRAALRRPELYPRRRSHSLHRAAVTLSLLILSCTFTDPFSAAAADPPPAERVLVTDVADGDTISVLRGRRQETVRLIGVDTPETGRPDTPVQFYGPEAALFTRRSLLEKRVRLEFEAPGRPGGATDKYERTLAYVFTDDGKNFNLELVRRGFGRAYTRYPFHYQAAFVKAEQAARRAGRGMWNKERRAAWSDPARRGKVIGNIRTEIYHVPGQRSYDSIGEKNRIYFGTERDAQDAGFRKARN
ncbi:MAG: thermonuclease family protein [Nitrospirota bacterium]